MNIARLLSRDRSSRRRSRKSLANSRRTMPVAGIQRLENRTLLAGDVTAQFVGRNAVLRGDAADNSIEVVVDAGRVIVRGLDGTTINGGSAEFVLAQNTDRLRSDLRAFLGAGNDRFVVGDGVRVGDNLRIWAGAGDDQIAVTDTAVSDTVSIHGGAGLDTISVQDSTISDHLRIHGGSGSSLINISDTRVRDNVVIHGGRSADDIVLNNATIGDNAHIHGHGGSDNIVLQDSSIGENLRTFAGAGNDVVMADNTTVGHSARVFAGSGNDNVVGQSTTVRRRFKAFGGAGNDAIEVDAVGTARRHREYNFESMAVEDAIIEARITDPQTGALARAAAAAQSFDPALTLTVDSATVDEDGGTGVAMVTITRHADATSDLSVSLTSSDPSLLALATATVTIPAGQSSATVELNAIDNSTFAGDVTVTITATADGLDDGTVDVTVTDDEIATLTVDISEATIVEDDGTSGNPGAANTATATVSRDTDSTSALTVNLASSATGRLSVPATVTIPAGQATATFTITTIPNADVDGNVNVAISATSAGFVTGTDSITVTDNDSTLTLSVGVADASVAENAGNAATTVTVSRSVASASPLTVALGTSNSTRVSIPANATIAANQTSVTVNLNTINNNIVDGDALIVITATAPGATAGQGNLTVTDDDTATIVLTPSAGSVNEDEGTLTLNVARTGPTTAEETIALTYSAGAKISGPSTVTLGVGVQDVDVTLNIADDTAFDDDTITTVTAATPGQPTVSTNITVVNDEILTLTLDNSSNTTVQSVGTLVTKDETYTVAGTTAPGATVALELDGNSAFDDGQTTAAPDGTFSIEVTLTNDSTNLGANEIDVRSRVNSGDEVFSSVDIHYALGTVMRFDVNQDLDGDSTDDFYDVELLDADAPGTVDNFLDYVTSGRYQNMFVHRSPEDFVIQGGGFTVENGTVSNVPTFGTIQGEFNAANSNVRGTLSMALTSAGPNSGTSQWFVNVTDNGTGTPADLDAVGHTVFGRVIGEGMMTVDLINTLTLFDLRGATGNSALRETPITIPPLTALTGTASSDVGSSVVTGAGTLFTMELQVGDVIALATDLQFRVASIQSNTQLTVQFETAAQANHRAVTNVVPALVIQPPDNDFIVFSNIGELLDTV